MITDEQIITIEASAALLQSQSPSLAKKLSAIPDAVRAMRADLILTKNALQNAKTKLAKPKGRR